MLIHDMQHHIVIGCIPLVAVDGPVRRAYVHLDVAGPLHLADADTGVEEIGACIMVILAGTQNDDRLAIDGGQPAVEHLVQPYVMQESLGHQLNISFILSKKPRSCLVGLGLKLSCFCKSSRVFFSSLLRFLGTHTLRHTSRSPRP